VFFKSISTLPQRIVAAQTIYNSGLVEIVYLNVSKTNNIAINTDKRYTIDNLILVNFINPTPTANELNTFMTQFNLTLYSAPPQLTTTSSFSYTYIFEAQYPQSSNPINIEYIINLLRNIYTSSTVSIRNVSPNIIISYNKNIENDPNPDPSPYSSYYTTCAGLNDSYSDYQWYIDNDGFNQVLGSGAICGINNGANNINATVGADAKICDCWSAGLSGSGIKIGIIAPGDVCDIHEDMSKQPFTTAWDCTGNTCVALTPAVAPGYNTGNGTLMHIAGILGADKNNNKGIAGIAENSTIVPFKVGEMDDFGVITVTSSSIINALQTSLAINNQVDVLILDYSSAIENSNISDELFKHHLQGRYDGTEVSYGTIIVAPAGHTIDPSTTINNVFGMYPASYNFENDAWGKYPEVIGVITSNRWDHLEVGEYMCGDPFMLGNDFNMRWPANYSSEYDVAAPGGPFYSTYGHNGYMDNYEYGAYQDANSIAIVGGVAALMLESKPLQYDDEMLKRIRDGADKVGGYLYTGFFNKSTELAGGRINCSNSKNFNPTSIKDVKNENLYAELINKEENWMINFESAPTNNLSYEIFNNIGQLISNSKSINFTKSISINNQNFASGIYYIKISIDNKLIVLKAIK